MSDPTIPPSDPTPPPPPAVSYSVPSTPPTGGLFARPLAPLELVTDPNARTWGLLAHLSTLAGLFIPFGNIVGPLVVWQMKKDEIPFAGDQAKEALNFHITMSIAMLVSAALICLVIGIALLPLVALTSIVFSVLGALAANKGEWYRYPMTIRLVK